MRVADIEIDRDHTLTLFCEADQTAKVDAMFAENEKLRSAAGKALEAFTSSNDLLATMYLKMDAVKALHAALKEPK